MTPTTLPQPLKPATTQVPGTPLRPPTALGVNSVSPHMTGFGGMSSPTQTPPAYTNPTSSGVSLSPTNPQSDLRGQTIGVGPTANRMNIANTYEQNWNAQTQPQYQADLRSATSQAAGAGQLGSGQLRTSLGNLAYNRDVQRNADEGNFLNTALNGTIQDAYNNVAQANQQQQFQAGLQNQTFGQGLQSLLVGQQGNPADTQLALSQLYGNQASQAGQGLNSLIGNTVNNNTQQSVLQQLMRGLGGSGTSTPLPVGTPIYNNGTQYGGVTG